MGGHSLRGAALVVLQKKRKECVTPQRPAHVSQAGVARRSTIARITRYINSSYQPQNVHLAHLWAGSHSLSVACNFDFFSGNFFSPNFIFAHLTVLITLLVHSSPGSPSN